MLNIYCQTIEAATDRHAPWYSNFASAFLFCQLTNRLLLSYMESYVTEVTAPQWEKTKDFQEKIDALPRIGKRTLACDLDIEKFLNLMISELPVEARKQKNLLMCMGLEISGFHDEATQIDLEELKKKVPDVGWHQIIKGLLNCYEFSHLSSIVEQGLKAATQNKTAQGVVSFALKQSPELCEHLQSEVGLSRDSLVKIWDLFLHVRNMYAHSFGFMDEKNIEQIQNCKKDAVDAIEMLDFRWNTLSFDAEELFPAEKCRVGEMYLLGDSEMNMFRNFARIFMPALAKYYCHPPHPTTRRRPR